MISASAAARLSSGPDVPLSPLRYPGGKQALAPYAAAWLKANRLYGREWVEPFAGGASLALTLLHAGAISKATLVERDPLVFAFWRCVFTSPGLLCDRVWKLDISMKTWRDFQRFLDKDALGSWPLLDCAVAGLFFNRVNYSGIIAAKPIGGMSQSSDYEIGCRFTKETIIDRICDAAAFDERVSVNRGDGISFLRRRGEAIAQAKAAVYVDPPYYRQGRKLYRYHFKDRQHTALADALLDAPFKWLVSYDDDPYIVKLYRECWIRQLPSKYSVRQQKQEDELAISNARTLPTSLQASRMLAGTAFDPTL